MNNINTTKISNDLKEIKKQNNDDAFNNISMIFGFFIIFFVLLFLFNSPDAENKTLEDKIVVLIALPVIVAPIILFFYFRLTAKYRAIKPSKWCYKKCYITRKQYEKAYTDYDTDGKAIEHDARYLIGIDGEKYMREGFPWAYNKVQEGKEYIIIFTGRKLKENNVSVFSNKIINAYKIEDIIE